MAQFPLFTVEELGAAFALLLPDARARKMAKEWFATNVSPSEIDSEGRFVYEPPLRHAEGPEIGYSGSSRQWASSGGDADYEAPRNLSDDALTQLLMSFSDIHLDLAAAISPALAARVRVLRGDSPFDAERRATQIHRVIAALTRR